MTDYPIVVNPAALEPGKGVLYVTTDKSPPKLPPVPANKQASFLLSEDWLDDTDPAHAFPSPQFRAQLEYATGLQLLNYPDASGARGARLVPDAAAAMPTVTDGGRLYTFRIRKGYRFSPPSNEPVTAETFRYSIERALSPGLGQEAPGSRYLGDVVGATAFHNGNAQHVSGITVSGNRLRIRLVAPAGDFLTRLSTPFFAAVPIGTPIVDGGVQTPIPSAGPYYLDASFQDTLRVLERNPNYHGPRPARLERIVYDLNTLSQHAASHIELGTADYTADVLGDSQFRRGGSARHQVRRQPGRGRATGDALRADNRRGPSSCSTRRTARSRAFGCGAPSISRSTARLSPLCRAMSRARSTFLRPSPAGAARRWCRSSPTLPRPGSSRPGSTAP